MISLVVGAAFLAATLRAPVDSNRFFLLGILAAGTWILGALVSGPIPLASGDTPRLALSFRALVLSVITFLAFLAADLVGQHLPLVSAALHNVLTKADSGPTALVLGVALMNGVGEELFFRGALFDALGSRRPVVVSTVVYVAVTVATGNVALVLAAVAMGTIFALQRARSGGILAPMVTHVGWSTLMLLCLPR